MKLDEDLTELEKKKVEILKENNQLEQALDSVLGDLVASQRMQQEQMQAQQTVEQEEPVKEETEE